MNGKFPHLPVTKYMINSKELLGMYHSLQMKNHMVCMVKRLNTFKMCFVLISSITWYLVKFIVIVKVFKTLSARYLSELPDI